MPANTLELSTSIHADASRDAVRAVFDAVSAWPRWCDPVTEASGTVEEGGRVAFRVRMAGVPVPFDVTVDTTTLDTVRWSSWKGPIEGVRTWTFEDLGDGTTRITDHKRFSTAWLPIALVYPRPIIRAMSERWLAALADEAVRRDRSGV